MLTQDNLFPENPAANCMSASVPSEQIGVAVRCIKAFYQGLKWADRSGIHGGYVGNRNFRRVFLMEDSHVLGVFDNRNSSSSSKTLESSNPSNIEEFVRCYQQGRGNIKTFIVLEKDNQRLANSEAVGHQSKFLIDVVYPSIEGIRAKLSGDEHGRHWQKVLSEAKYVARSTDPYAESILHMDLLSDIYHNPKKVDQQLAAHSPLRLFYMWNSPLNIEFGSGNTTSSQLIPWEIENYRRLPNTL
ncbi:hypothetical protein [Leptolyngbya sp. Heron Island J]|uniref:hypothetical protein n=1 Tax=Leptolyngbya sp. Heron Island J TaxID=1385935 RepID=UPI0012690F05|nr:hypothetical protein [Leptolyngbya sp. Heron Island J]